VALKAAAFELIDDFFAEYPATAVTDEADEVIDAIAKTVEPAGRRHPAASEQLCVKL
jgi:hypothetical protein